MMRPRPETRRLLSFVARYRWRVALSVALVLLSSAAQTAGPAIIGMAIDLYLAPTHSRVSLNHSLVARWAGSLDPFHGISLAALVYLAVLVAAFALSFLQMMSMNSVGQRVMSDLRRAAFQRLQVLDVAYFDRRSTGSIMTVLTSDVDALNEFLTAGLVVLCSSVLLLVAMLCILFAMDWRLALILFSITPLMLVVTRWFRQGVAASFRSIRAAVADMNTFLQEHISGMAVVQLFNREEEERMAFAGTNERHTAAQVRSVFYYAVFYPAVEVMQTAGMALMLWFGARMVLHGDVSIGVLTAFVAYAQRFYDPMADLSEKYNLMAAARAAGERIAELIDAPVTMQDGSVELDTFRTLELRNVWFAYEGEEWVLKDVSFTLDRGQSLAIVGHTGAGKSTLMNLLLRFYDAQRGTILVNGVDIRTVSLGSLRRLFALVSQEVVLFSGSIAENLALREGGVPLDVIRQAAQRVQADALIARTADAYATQIRGHAAEFSLGEKQLLSFARALVANAPVLLLDEATASIDSETERLVQQAIEEMLRGRTSLTIAHRLSTVRSADQILVMHRGELRERGTHEELLARDGLYRRLCAAQLQYQSQSQAEV